MVIIAGDAELGARSAALAELYERHSRAAVRLAYLITGDPELSRDIAQDAFVRIAGRFRHRRFPDAFDAYLRRTVVNLCSSHFRKQRVERAYADRARALGEPEASEGTDLDLRDDLAAALLLVPVRQRAALVLRHYEDLSEADVASALRCSVPAAHALIVRGMRTLREIIHEEDDHDA